MNNPGYIFKMLINTMTWILLLVWGYLWVGLMSSYPTLNSQSVSLCKSRLHRGRFLVKVMNQTQAEYFLVHQTFSSSLNQLKLFQNHPQKTPNYLYWMRRIEGAALHYAIPRQAGYKSYLGIVWVQSNQQNQVNLGNSEIAIDAILCEGEDINIMENLPQSVNGSLVCPEGTEDISETGVW
jgi:hypothetical protein